VLLALVTAPLPMRLAERGDAAHFGQSASAAPLVKARPRRL